TKGRIRLAARRSAIPGPGPPSWPAAVAVNSRPDDTVKRSFSRHAPRGREGGTVGIVELGRRDGRELPEFGETTRGQDFPAQQLRCCMRRARPRHSSRGRKKSRRYNRNVRSIRLGGIKNAGGVEVVGAECRGCGIGSVFGD